MLRITYELLWVNFCFKMKEFLSFASSCRKINFFMYLFNRLRRARIFYSAKHYAKDITVYNLKLFNKS